MTPADLTAMAHAIAYQAAVSDIECFCVGRETPDSPRRWYDLADITGNDESIVADVKRAAQYLDARGLLIRRHDAPHLVQFRSADAAPLGGSVFAAIGAGLGELKGPLDLGAWPFDKLGITAKAVAE